MNGYNVVVVSPSGKKTEYESKRDFWRHSNYGLGAIDKAVKTGNPLKDGTRVKLKNQFRVIAFKSNETLKFTSLRKASEHFRCSKLTISRKIQNGEEFNGWTFDVLI